MKKKQDLLTREQVLLRAASQLLSKQDNCGYVLNLLSEATVWDSAMCDGNCLLEEINDLLLASDIDAGYIDPNHEL